MADEFDEIASPDFLLKAVETSGAKGAFDGASRAAHPLFAACQEIERQIKVQDRSAEVLRRQETALKEAALALTMGQLRQLAVIVVSGAILIAAGGAAWHFIGKEPREVLYGCTQWEGKNCLRWQNLDSLRPK